MDLNDFLQEVIEAVEMERDARKDNPDDNYPYLETVFTEMMMSFLSEKGFIPDDVGVAFYDNSRYGKLSGFAFSEENDKVDLVNTLYFPDGAMTEVTNEQIQKEANRVLTFVNACITGELMKRAQLTDDVRAVAQAIQEKFNELDTFGIYILTNGRSQNLLFNDLKWKGKKIKLDVIDIGRYFSLSEQGNKGEIIIDFNEKFGKEPPCIYVRGKDGEEYDYALAIMPGDILNELYDEYGPRILEANVRSFLSFKGKVNKGIQETLQEAPENFFAYNNGLVIVADEIAIREDKETNTNYIHSVQGFQVVNGGQTTASMFFAEKRGGGKIQLEKVKVAAKIIIPKTQDLGNRNDLYRRISQYANTQNIVRIADLSSNSEFQRRIEELSNKVVLSDFHSRVFYERAKGSFNVFLSKEAKTTSQRESLKRKYPIVITKTDLAKYLNSWNGRPWEVARGAQKNFVHFMRNMEIEWPPETKPEERSTFIIEKYNEQWFKDAVAKAFLYRDIDKVVARNVETPSKASIDTYTVALIAEKFADLFNLEEIWRKWGLTNQQKTMVYEIALKVNQNLIDNHGNSIFTEWTKKEECWEKLKAEGDLIRAHVIR